MGTKKQQGFTILETLLFVAITGVLLVSLLAGTAFVIQRQRYTDSVNATQGFFQQQYSEVLNVINERSGNEACENAENLVQPADGAEAENPGTSRCVVLGKAIDVPTSVGERGSITSFTVVGSEPAGSIDPDITDDELIRQYQPALVRLIGVNRYEIPWGAQVVNAIQGGPERAPINRLLLLRSPKSGVTYTYSYNTQDTGASVGVGVDAANRRYPVNVCLRSADLISSTSVVRIAMSGGPEAVSTAFDIANPAEQCSV